MATSGELAHALSTTLGIKLGTVNFYGQHLRDAGLLSTSGRGPSAATMTETDAINWLIAMCCAETAKSAPGIVEITRDTPLYDKSVSVGDPDADLSFLSAGNVAHLLSALLEDVRAHRLNSALITLDFYGGGGHVKLLVAGFDGNTSGVVWRVEMEFIRTFGDRPAIRHKDPEETPIFAKRTAINRVSRGVFEDINAILAS